MRACWCESVIEQISRSVPQSCPTLCNPMDGSVQNFPVLHHLLQFAQTHVHWSLWYNPAISSFIVSFSSFNLSQHQSLFQWVGFLHQVAKASVSASVLPMNIQGWFPLGLTGLISLLSKGLSRVFSSTTVLVLAFWKHQGDQDSISTFSSIAYIFHMMISNI